MSPLSTVEDIQQLASNAEKLSAGASKFIALSDSKTRAFIPIAARDARVMDHVHFEGNMATVTAVLC